MPTSTQSVKFTGLSATPPAFALGGGKYAVSAIATGTGTMGLQMLMPDGVTFNPVHTAFATTTGFTTVDLPAGQYQFSIATFTAVSVSITSIPD